MPTTREELEQIRDEAKVQADYLREVGGVSDHYLTHFRMAKAHLAVLDLHKYVPADSFSTVPFCDICEEQYPCQTIQAIEREMWGGR
jgi:hypothetical protein